MRALTNGKYEMRSYVNTCNGVILLAKKEIPFYALGADTGEQPRTVLSGLDYKIKQQSLYLDGVIYLLGIHDSIVSAFDIINDETVTSIDLPGEQRRIQLVHYKLPSRLDGVAGFVTVGEHPGNSKHASSKLMEMSVVVTEPEPEPSAATLNLVIIVTAA
ncbi:hypothetical protein E2562_014810 [Oryza meyeriana var. granulata]|uniref:Uncharacterized protein n=1 Tax=Oryza meyeriana var. granulata TaxID=110450 RepID=A0A6G1BW35_9ORYZ|nr:hypothetical protein E2562_014810 [Oryza meyeriana var. granulata]